MAEGEIDEEELARWAARVKAKPKDVTPEEAEHWNLGHTNKAKAGKLNEKKSFRDKLYVRDRLRQIAGLPIGNAPVKSGS